MARPRARAIVFPSVNMPLAPVRNLGVYVSFALRALATLASYCPRARNTVLSVLWPASRVRARLDHLR